MSVLGVFFFFFFFPDAEIIHKMGKKENTTLKKAEKTVFLSNYINATCKKGNLQKHLVSPKIVVKRVTFEWPLSLLATLGFQGFSKMPRNTMTMVFSAGGRYNPNSPPRSLSKRMFFLFELVLKKVSTICDTLKLLHNSYKQRV